jgi:hypothetical protein
VAFRDRLRRLQRLSEGEAVTIRQTDGTVKRFPESALREAFIEDLDRTAGRVGPETPVHPILTALRNSGDPAPLGLFMGGGEGSLEPLEDLSEDPS